MLGAFLQTGKIEDYIALGDVGQPVYTASVQLIAALSRKSPALANFLAVPKINDKGTIIDWFSPVVGQVLQWHELTEQERSQSSASLLSFRDQVIALSGTLQASAKNSTEKIIFGKLLGLAPFCPDEAYIRFIRTSDQSSQTLQPVLTFWGFVRNEADRAKSALYFLEKPIGSVPVAQTLAATSPVVTPPLAPVAEQVPWWMFWRRIGWGCLWMLLLPLLLLTLLGLLQSCVPALGGLSLPNLPKIPTVDQGPSWETVNYGDRVNCDANIGAGDSASGEFMVLLDLGNQVGPTGILYDAQQWPANYTLEWNGQIISTGYVGDSVHDEALLAAGVMQEAIRTGTPSTAMGELIFIKDSAEPTEAKLTIREPLSSSAKFRGLCPPNTETVNQPSGPTIQQEAFIPAPLENVEQSMSQQPIQDAAQAENTAPLEEFTESDAPEMPQSGSRGWAGEEIREERQIASISGVYKAGGLQDTRTGKPLRVEYQIDNGKGTLSVKRPDGSECKGDIVAQQLGEKISIAGDGAAHCNDGTRYEMPSTECSSVEGELKDCSARYDADAIPMHMIKN